MGEWSKLGLILPPLGKGQARTHAMLPCPITLGGVVRVYFASCDEDLRGRIFMADLDPTDPTTVLRVYEQPVLDLGQDGEFDADGVNPSHLVEHDGALFLYYIGWKRCSAEVPYTLLAGLAVSEDGGNTFAKVSRKPILPPIQGELYFRTAPHVYKAEGGWVVLYIGGDKFISGPGGKRLPLYGLYRTHSKDGVQWESATEMILSPDRARGEIGFGRPYLWKDLHGTKTLMLSIRTEAGYTALCEISAFDRSLRSRNFKEVVPRSGSGWDSEMVCFGAPCIIDQSEYLFYNGNGFGRTGIGLAKRVAAVAGPS